MNAMRTDLASQSITLIPSSPYSHLYPNTILVTRGELNLIKILRQNSLVVEIRLEGDKDHYYVIEKGVKEILEHPLTLFLVGLPISVILNIYSNHLYDKYFSTPAGKSELVIQKQENGTTVYYSQDGKELSLDQIDTIFKRSKDLFFTEDYKTVKPESPYPKECPHPIYLEHTNKIIGWGQVDLGDRGLVLKNGVITDENVQESIDEGKLKGLSITGVVKSSKCSICHNDYFMCPHISGEKYDGVKCVNTIDNIELININLVKEPINPDALLKLKTEELDN